MTRLLAGSDDRCGGYGTDQHLALIAFLPPGKLTHLPNPGPARHAVEINRCERERLDFDGAENRRMVVASSGVGMKVATLICAR